MKSGYDSFFKTARKQQNKKNPPASVNLKRLKEKSSSSDDVKQRIAIMKKELDKKRQRRIRRSFPIQAVGFLVISLGAAGYIATHLENVEGLLSRVEIQFLGDATAAEAETKPKSDATKAAPQSKDAQSKEATAENTKPKESTLSVEELALFKGLEERRVSLDERESEIKKMEEELQKQKEELDKRLVEIEKTRKSIANQLEEKVKVDQERVDQLVSFYSSMKPQQAAKIIETLNEDLAVEVLLKMKKKSAAEVLNLMVAEKAQKLSERFAGYKQK